MQFLAKELLDTKEGFEIDEEFLIAVLLWVDDVISCAEGVLEQNKMLERIHLFATKHKIKWGAEKCNVMRVGAHRNKNEDWKSRSDIRFT